MAFDFDKHLNAAVVTAFGEKPEDVSYGRLGEPPFTLPGVFTRDYVEVGFGSDGAPVSARQTRFFAQISAFPEGIVPAGGDLISVAGGAWTVSDVRPDGAGGVLLLLGAREDDWEPRA